MNPERESPLSHPSQLGRHLGRHVGRHLALLCGFLALTFLMLWPLPQHLGSHVLKAIYYWDAYTNTMLLSSRVEGLFGDGPLGPYDSYFFAPIADSIVFNENLFGLSLLYAPFLWASNNPLLAYNLTLITSFVLSQYFTYLLVLRLTGSQWASILAGFAFALSPYATYEMGRIQLVAQQWIPLCLLFACRAFERRRLIDLVGLALSYVLLVGTCLYYAMFLVPLLSCLVIALSVRYPPTRAFLAKAGAIAVPTAGIIVLMISPYFTSRDQFDLTRTAEFAQRYDGELGFFLNVHSTNLSLGSLHHHTHQTEQEALEQIAFPGFTIFALSALGLLIPLIRYGRTRGAAALGKYLTILGGLALVGSIGTALTHSMLAGALCLAGAWLLLHRYARALSASPYSENERTHIALFLVSLVLFLGMEPFSFGGEPVAGLYHYLYTYVPGMDGIRKVSRQACMTTLWFAMLASFGLASLLKPIASVWLRGLLTTLLLCALIFELRTFPHPLEAVWARDDLPPVYAALAQEPRGRPVAVTPVNFGQRKFRGHRGLALHNYMAAYHGHRTINGKSSYIPPATRLAWVALAALPNPGAIRILRQLGTEYLLVHGEDYPERNRAWLLSTLDGLRSEFELIFREADTRLYRLARGSLPLQQTPNRPKGAVLASAHRLRTVNASERRGLNAATDGRDDTMWSTRRAMRPGDFIEFELREPARLIMVELQNPVRPIDLPISYKVEVVAENGAWQTVAERPELQLYQDQVYSPRSFSLRIPLRTAIRAQRMRISVVEPVPNHALSITEATLWTRQPSPSARTADR